MTNRILCIGECMVELAPTDDGTYRQGFAGDTFNMAWYLRRLLPGAGSRRPALWRKILRLWNGLARARARWSFQASPLPFYRNLTGIICSPS